MIALPRQDRSIMPAPDEIVKKPTAYNSGQNAQM
jgi:hypothetical protein